MDFISTFRFLIEKLNGEGIDFAIIGGLALQFSGITRTTLDIDRIKIWWIKNAK